MSFIAVATVFCICLSMGSATYGPDHKHAESKHHYDGPKQHYDAGHHHHDAHKHVNEPNIHLNSPKIILNRPSINVHEGAGHHHSPLHEDEPIILGHDKPLYIRKSLHGIHSGKVVAAAHPAPVPILLDGGYSQGKVLDISAPIQVINHAPIVHERPILIRRPVVVSKSLSGTQDSLEKLHYAHSGITHSAGYGEFAVPLSKALHERTVVYGDLAHGYGGLTHGYGGLGHGYGGLAHGYGGLAHGYGGLAHGYGGHIGPALYSAPLLVQQPKALLLEQPKAYGHSSVGILSGGQIHGHAHGSHLHAANQKKY